MRQTQTPYAERQVGADSPPVAPGNGFEPRRPGIDRLVERRTRALYEGLPRRGFLTTVGRLALIATGAQVVPLLPLDRTTPKVNANHACDVWYYCRCNCPRLCSCCVGGANCTCPPGTFTSAGGLWWGC
jgi:hypothetical protein